MTLTEINALTLNDVFSTIAYRILTTPFTMLEDETASPYDNLVMSDTVETDPETGVETVITHVKPPITDFEADFTVYQQELTVLENERLRVEDLITRFDAITSIHSILSTALGVYTPNSEAFKMRELIVMDSAEAETKMLAIEAEYLNQQPNRDLEECYRLRIEAYGSLQDQLDEQFHDFEAWKLRIQAVKDQYPKPVI